MKLKPIVASICLLGLAAATPAFAHSKMKGDVAPMNAVGQTNLQTNHSDTNALLARADQAAQMDAIINNNQGALIDQDPALGNDWFKRIKISGVLNIDSRVSSMNYAAGGGLGSGANYYGEGYTSGISVNNSHLDVDMQVADWVKAHMTIGNGDNSMGGPSLAKNQGGATESWLNEAYVTLGDLSRAPVYLSAGRMYANFGNYQRYQMTNTLTTDLTETSGNMVKLGYVKNGVYGSVYLTDGANSYAVPGGATHPSRLQNGGANLGYTYSQGVSSMDVGASFIWNMADVNLISNAIGGTYQGNGVRGAAAHAYFNYGPFGLKLNGVGALEKFATNDLMYGAPGAQPWALGAQGDYNFNSFNRSSQAYLSYQVSGGAVALSLPQYQTIAGYRINLNKMTDLEFQLIYNQDYDTYNTGGANAKPRVGGVTALQGSNRADVEGAVRLSVRV